MLFGVLLAQKNKEMKTYDIEGRIVDGTTFKPLEMGAKVVLLGSEGKVLKGTKTDEKGDYKLSIPIKAFPNPIDPMIPLFLPESDTIQIRSAVSGTHDPKTIKLDLANRKKQYNDYLMPIKLQVEDEVTITADPEIVKCIRELKGKWDYDMNNCIVTEEASFWQKHKVKIIIGLLITAVLITTIVIALRKK